MRYLLIALFAWLAFPSLSWAIAPYIQADHIKAGEVRQLAGKLEDRLKSAGFEPLGEYCPSQLANSCVVVVTDKGLLDAIGKLGGDSIVAAAIRISVKSNGDVSYMNPDYWYRAYFRSQFPQVEQVVQDIQDRLAKALGSRGGFGGDESAEDLPGYRYLIGMERFESDKNLLATYPNFDDAVNAVRDNLKKGVARTGEVYEVVIPDKQLAVFGVAMNDESLGDGRWIAKIGMQNEVAALPYEVFIVGNKVKALYGRYRIALSFPALSMGSFMQIAYTPSDILTMLSAVARWQGQ
jgi:hypothetical protein